MNYHVIISFLGIYFAADFKHSLNVNCTRLQGTENNTMCDYVRLHARLFPQVDGVNVLKMDGKFILTFWLYVLKIVRNRIL